MRTLRWAALAALTLASPAAMAGDFGAPSVSVYGAIGIGPGNIAIQQNSTANFAGVLQVGPGVTTSIQQTGQHNAAVVGQVGDGSSANVLQNGGRNRALVRQLVACEKGCLGA